MFDDDADDMDMLDGLDESEHVTEDPIPLMQSPPAAEGAMLAAGVAGTAAMMAVEQAIDGEPVDQINIKILILGPLRVTV